MFVTVERVKNLTGYNVELEDIAVAQGIIETYTGRMEATVEDADDLELFAKATAYQTVYLKTDPNRVFEQAAVASITQDSSAIDFKPGDYASPFIAPLAVMALRQLTWKKSRSIHTGKFETEKKHRLGWRFN